MAENTIEIEVELVGQQETLKGLDKVKQGAEGIGESFKGVGDLVGKTNQQLGEGLSSVSDAVGGSIEAFSGMSEAIKGVSMTGSGLLGLLGPIGAVVGAAALAYESFMQLTWAAQETEDMAEAVAAAAGDLQSKLEALAEGGVALAGSELREFTRITLDAQIAKEKLQKSYERLQKPMERELKAQEALAKAQKEVERLSKATGSASMGLAAAINEQTRAEQELTIATAELNTKLAGLEARQIAVNNAIAKAAEAQQGYEELTKDALKTKAQELSERQKSLEIMEAERFLQDDLAELSAQKIIAEQEAAKRKLAIEEMTRDQLLNTVSATERLLKTSQEGTQIELANSRAVMKVYEEQAKKRAATAQAEMARKQTQIKMEQALARQQIMAESQLRQLQIKLTQEGTAEQIALARERYDTGLQLAQDDATKRAIVEAQYQLEIKRIKDAELDADYARVVKREEMQKQALERSRELAFSTAEFNAQFIQDETERELAQLKVKYDRELELAENNEALKTELMRRYGMERMRVEQKASQALMEQARSVISDYGKGFAEAAVGAALFGESFQDSIANVLNALASEAGVKAIMETAYGTAALLLNRAQASAHFSAAGIFAGAAGLARAGGAALGGGGGGGGTPSASPSGAPLSAPAPQREQASTEAMTFNINFGGAVIYDTRRAAEQALADRVVETINRPRRGAVRMNSRG